MASQSHPKEILRECKINKYIRLPRKLTILQRERIFSCKFYFQPCTWNLCAFKFLQYWRDLKQIYSFPWKAVEQISLAELLIFCLEHVDIADWHTLIFLEVNSFGMNSCKQRWMNTEGAWLADQGKLQSSFSMAFLRLHLDSVWSADPQFKRNMEKLGRVQGRTTKLIRVWSTYPQGVTGAAGLL